MVHGLENIKYITEKKIKENVRNFTDISHLLYWIAIKFVGIIMTVIIFTHVKNYGRPYGTSIDT